MGFKKKTVFVVGAGAHVDYGMPTGPQLIAGLRQWSEPSTYDGKEMVFDYVASAIDLVCRNVKGNAQWCHETEPVLYRQTYAEARQKIERLVAQLTRSSHESIDSLLSFNKSLERIGKWIIAAMILQKEQAAIQLPGVLGWHRWLCKRFAPSRGPNGQVESWKFDNCDVVTFNYDRLFDYHMQTLVRNWNGASTTPVELPSPVHVYGRLHCEPEWGVDLCRYTTRPRQMDVVQSGLGIKIADDRDIDDEHFATVKKVLVGAEQIVFLGFAFDPTNLVRLGLRSGKDVTEALSLSKETRVFATAYEKDRDMVRRAEEAFAPLPLVWGLPEKSCYECLKSWDIL